MRFIIICRTGVTTPESVFLHYREDLPSAMELAERLRDLPETAYVSVECATTAWAWIR